MLRLVASFAPLLIAATSAFCAVPATVKPWTTGDILAMRAVSDPRLSPDGTRVAYVVHSLLPDSSGYASDVWIAPVAGGDPVRMTAWPGADEFPRWSPDGTTLAFLSDRPLPGASGPAPAQIWRIATTGGEASPLTNAPCGVSAFEWSRDGRSLAFLACDGGAAPAGLDARPPEERHRWTRAWVTEAAGTAPRAVTPPGSEVVGFSLSPDARTLVVALQAVPGLEGRFDSDLFLVPAAGGAPVPLVRRPGMDTSPRWSPDGATIAFVSQGGRDREWYTNNGVWAVPAAGGEPRPLTPDLDEWADGLGAGGLEWLPDGRGVIFFATLRTAQRLLRAGLDGTLVPLTHGDRMDHSPSVDARGAIAWVSEDAIHPADVWFRPETGAARRLTDVNPGARERTNFPKTPFRWRGADGAEIDGLLILPPGAAGGRLPLVVRLHGGPSDAFGHTCTTASRGFPHALWAQRGWAVFLPNPRGSGGYGEAFRAAIRGDWGGVDADDVMRGVDALVERGIADSTRLAVCGWSYGGYLTAVLVTKTARFRAAIVGAGVANLTSMTGTSDIPGMNRSYFGGWPWQDPAAYVDRSPLFHVGRVTTPTLVIHGDHDDRVPMSQGLELYRALRAAGVTSEMRLLPGSGHTPHDPRVLRLVQESLLEWIDRWAAGGGRKNPRNR